MQIFPYSWSSLYAAELTQDVSPKSVDVHQMQRILVPL